MSTLLTTIIVGQALLSSVVLMLVSSFSVTRKLPGLLIFSVMNLLLSLSLLGIWFNMSYFIGISRGQEVTYQYTLLTETVDKSPERSQTWPHMVRHSN